jgi:vancomycin resistance protein VanJ
LPRSSPALQRLSLGYSLLITLWLLLRLIFFDTIWWLALANTVALYLFLPLPPLLLSSLLRRCWAALSALASPLLCAGWLFGPLFLPPWPPPSSSDTTTLSIMTFNLLYKNRDLPAIESAIRSARPDLVGVQEITGSQRSALQERLSAEYPYTQFHQSVGLFSRFPIRATTTFALPPRNEALHTRLTVEQTLVHVLVVHLTPNRALHASLPTLGSLTTAHYATQAAEVAFIEQELRSIDGPTILLCDCNLTETSQAYAQLAAQLRDSFREAGWGFGNTYPASPLPLLRYDYIWHSDELRAEAAEVRPAAGSDHLPVLARLRLLAR